MTNITTTMNGNECLTKVDLGFDRRVLRISTSKMNRGIACIASVVQMNADGHGFSFVLYGDYNKTLARDANARATAKAVRTMHDVGLGLLDAVIEEVRAKYRPDVAIGIGDRIHYSGDVSNQRGWFVITREVGDYLYMTEEGGEGREFNARRSSIGHRYEGHCNPRMVTEAAYNAYRPATKAEA